MISKHVHYEAAHDNYGALARYIADASHEGEKCLMSWCAGCVTEDDYDLAILEAQVVQGMNTRSQKEKTYHLLVSFRPEDEATLTPELFKAIEARFADALGYAEHQRHCGIHKNTANVHMHIAYNMVHPERHTRHEPFRDYSIRDKLCRELEQEYGLTVDNGREQKQENGLSHKAATIEAQTGQESFESYAKRHKKAIADSLEQAQSWQGLHETLRTYGMGIKPHGNGLVITDLHGEHAVKASSIERGLSANRLQKSLGEFRPYRSLRQIEEKSRYQAVPLHRSPERGELFSRFKGAIDDRKRRLQTIKGNETAQLVQIRQKWATKRRELESMNIAKKNRRNLVALARKYEVEEIAKVKLTFSRERESVRQEIPFTSWQGFLKQEAEKGNEVALAVLRSRKEIVEPESNQQKQVTPVKDWSKHGLDYSAKAATRAEYAEKERKLLERDDISASSKKTLQAFLRMDQVITEAQAEGAEFGNIKRRIDGKGVVIFTLESGGSMRDTGKEIHFSGHDDMAKDVAARYAEKKWGKKLNVEKNHIKIMPQEVKERQTIIEINF